MCSTSDLTMLARAADTKQYAHLGTLLDRRYLVLDWLGAGGMGVVYRGVDLITKREVALKTIRLDERDELRRRERLAREARMLGRVSHPNLLRLVDVGFDEAAGPFLVVDHIPGTSLWDLIARERRLAPPRAIALMRQLLAGLAALHAAGIVHADVKSTNVIVTPREGGEHLTLIDFGLAREITAPRPALAFGTPAYMAPEMLFGNAATPAADQYAAGIVLYEMLTGMPPFIERKGRARPRHPRRPWVRVAPPARPAAAPGALDAIVRRALAKHPGDRFAGVVEMSGALGAVAQAQAPAQSYR